MFVLVVCEESQAVANAFRKFGHKAFSCDLQECSGGHPEYHILGDCLPLLFAHRESYCIPFTTQDGFTHLSPGTWDLIIAHPPCTYLAKSGSCNLTKNGIVDIQRYNLMLQAKSFFDFIYSLPGRVVIENPIPMKRCNLPPYSQTVQPFEFGDNFTKLTCLWLKNVPYLIPTNCILPGQRRNCALSWCKVHRTSKVRSKTFNGIASAMAQQWQF